MRPVPIPALKSRYWQLFSEKTKILVYRLYRLYIYFKHELLNFPRKIYIICCSFAHLFDWKMLFMNLKKEMLINQVSRIFWVCNNFIVCFDNIKLIYVRQTYVTELFLVFWTCFTDQISFMLKLFSIPREYLRYQFTL